MRKGQVIYTYFHFAAAEELTRAVIASGAIAVAYETVQLAERRAAAAHADVGGGGPDGGAGGGQVPGEGLRRQRRPARRRSRRGTREVVIIGGGVVGINAAKMAAGLGAHVIILDISLDRLRYLDDVLPANVDTAYSNRHNILDAIRRADLVIGAVLLPGAKAPHLVKRGDLKTMKPGSVIVDVAVDQGGCVETIKPTTHEKPTYFVDGILHYAVANMPGGVPRTSTLALTNATLPYALKLARQGWRAACKADPALGLGLNVVEGKVVYPGVAEAFHLPLTNVATVL